MKSRLFSIVLYALMAAGLGLAPRARAQANPITFSVSPAQCDGKCTPVATWSTNPTASSCTASDGWSGTKLASGSETLAQTTVNKKYTLTCNWGTSGSATLTWSVPTQDTNDQPLATGLLAGYNVLWGTSPTVLNKSQVINDPSLTTLTIPSLAAGNWCFQANGFTTQGASGPMTPQVCKTISGSSSSAASANVVVRQLPKPPGNFQVVVVETQAYQIVPDYHEFHFNVGRQVGTVDLGAACDENRPLGDGYYAVVQYRARVQLWEGVPPQPAIAAKCARG